MRVDALPRFSWQVVAAGASGPGPRSRHSLVHDDAENVTILFGGILWDEGGRYCADTWELRKSGWTNIEVAIAPPARHRAAMVYDPARCGAVLFGGQGNRGLLND